MIIVSDTTPIISLMKVGRLDLLHQLYGEICIPEAVYNELTASSAFRSEANRILQSTFIRIVEVQERRAVDILRRATYLDLGESEAIVYADKVKADILLMDERAGRKVAKSMGITVTGTVVILLSGFDEQLMNANDVLNALKELEKAGRWISNALLEYARQYVQK